ncbi:MAG TPA: alpha/beta hydrolase [Edaphobacter sp.]|nr:alpha/beta hydrolase [Edaphobacter sp.]
MSCIVLATVAVTGSSVFNTIASHRFWALHPPPGKILEVDGHRMHLHCMGQGSPTIVLDSGWGNDSFVWGEIQPQLAANTRVFHEKAAPGMAGAMPSPLREMPTISRTSCISFC